MKSNPDQKLGGNALDSACNNSNEIWLDMWWSNTLLNTNSSKRSTKWVSLPLMLVNANTLQDIKKFTIKETDLQSMDWFVAYHSQLYPWQPMQPPTGPAGKGTVTKIFNFYHKTYIRGLCLLTSKTQWWSFLRNKTWHYAPHPCIFSTIFFFSPILVVKNMIPDSKLNSKWLWVIWIISSQYKLSLHSRVIFVNFNNYGDPSYVIKLDITHPIYFPQFGPPLDILSKIFSCLKLNSKWLWSYLN